MSLFELTTNEIIKKYNLRAEKKFGQNFIINHSLTKKIVSSFEDIEEYNIIEIGPGPLSLTREIISKKPKKLILYELDNKFVNLLHDLKLEYQNMVDYHFQDALQINFEDYGDKLAIISNLPYNISTAFLIRSCRAQNINKMLLMFQKEVADRIIASPNSKVYGRLSVLAQSYYNIKKILNVSPNAFTPKPKVNSTILSFEYNNKVDNNISIQKLEKITEILFSMRRKKIGTILKGYNMASHNIDLNKRAEQLELKQFHELANLIDLSGKI